MHVLEEFVWFFLAEGCSIMSVNVTQLLPSGGLFTKKWTYSTGESRGVIVSELNKMYLQILVLNEFIWAIT
jgi:hypothetical protein